MKKLLFSAAMVAAVLSSCSKNEMVDNLPQGDNPNAIGLSTGVFATKAATTTSTLHGKDVTIYAAEADDTESVKLDGLTFNYVGSKWVQKSGTENWENVFANGAVSVYGLHDGATPVALTATAATGTATATTLTDGDEDYIYFSTKLSAIPTKGEISASFKHAVSRIKMTTGAGSGNTGAMNTLKLENVSNSGTPTITLSGNVFSWTSAGAQDQDYSYTEGDVANDLYIIPQAGSATSLTSTLEKDKTLVSGLMWVAINGQPTAGYKDKAALTDTHTNAKVYTDAAFTVGSEWTGSGAIYVKAAYPIVSTVNFEMGKYYNLTIDLSKKGFILENGYFDENGTRLYIKDGGDDPEEGDPTVPDATDVIGLTVSMEEWLAPASDKNL